MSLAIENCCNLLCQPQNCHHAHLHQIDPVARIFRVVDKEVGVLGVVHNEEEGQRELLCCGDEVEEQVECRYARALSFGDSTMQLRDERNCTGNQ
jgi:hypothetical protein